MSCQLNARVTNRHRKGQGISITLNCRHTQPVVKVSVDRLVFVITTHYQFQTSSFDSRKSHSIGCQFSRNVVTPNK
jgi:hypothetical protein